MPIRLGCLWPGLFMKPKDYCDLYRRTYATLGFTLGASDGISSDEIASAENKLGIKLPAGLRDYYLVAGHESALNHAYNQLYTPKELKTHPDKLVFMEENQCVVVWGIDVGPQAGDDPAVYQGPIVKKQPSGWHLEEKECSAFLVFMLHLQAAFGGGMPCTASGPAQRELTATLDDGWQLGGQVNGMRAYSRDKQAVCLVKWRDFFTREKTWRIFAGACDKDGLSTIASDLNLKWD